MSQRWIKLLQKITDVRISFKFFVLILLVCVEIFLPDDEARVLTLNLSQVQTLLNDLPVPVQALYIFDAIYLLAIMNMITW